MRDPGILILAVGLALVVGFAAGLLLAAIMALLLERMNSTIKSADEVEQKLGLPTLAGPGAITTIVALDGQAAWWQR